MNTNPFKPGDKVGLVSDHDNKINSKVLTIKEVLGVLVKLEGMPGLYHYTCFELVPHVEKTFEVGKKYKTISGIIGTYLFVGKYLSFFSYTRNSGEKSEFSVSNNYISIYQELPEEISCEKILLVLKPKEGGQYGDKYSDLSSCKQVIHNMFHNAVNGFLEHKIKYNLEAAFESNYKNGKIEMIDITEKFKEACGISS